LNIEKDEKGNNGVTGGKERSEVSVKEIKIYA
jgi:hypothetical protein